MHTPFYTKKKKEVVPEIKYYKSCSELFYYNFYKILETRDYRYLIVGWDEDSEVVFNKAKAIGIWKNIYGEYTRLRDDNKLLMYYEVCAELVYVQTRYDVVSKLLDQMGFVMDEEVLSGYVKELKGWEYSFSLNKPFESQMKNAYKQLKRSKNRITILTAQKEEFKPENEEDSSLMKQVVNLENALGRDEVDPKKVVVEKWILLIESVKEKIRLRNKSN